MADTKTLRNYATILQVEAYADIDITDDTEGLERMTMAEEFVDQYVGPQKKFLVGDRLVEVSSVNGQEVIDTSGITALDVTDDYYTFCVLEVIAGGGAGEIRRIESSSKANKSVTYGGDAISGLDATSVCKIYQIGKFPRWKDRKLSSDGTKYYKSIPVPVQRAVGAQMRFMIDQGDSFFNGDNMDKDSESIGNYSYSRGGASAQSSTIKMTAPKVRSLLRGIMNRKGRIVR